MMTNKQVFGSKRQRFHSSNWTLNMGFRDLCS